MIFRRSSIRQKLTRTTVLASGAALLLASVAFIAYDFTTPRDDMVRDLEILSQVIADNSAVALVFGDQAAATDVLGALRAQPNIVAACIYDDGGDSFAHYVRTVDQGLSCPPSPPASGHEFRDGELHFTHAVALEGERIGQVFFRSDLRALEARLSAFAGIALLIAGAALTAAYLLSKRFQGAITQPLFDLVSLAKSVSEKKNYSVRAERRSDDEIGLLVDAFNDMLGTIEERERERERAEKHLADAIESVSEGFALWDSDDRLVLFNTNYLKVFQELADVLVTGVHFEDFIKAAVERGVYETNGESVQNFVAGRLAEHRDPTEAFERHVGGERWVRISKRRTESGGVVGIWTDITDKKRTEDEIRDLAMSDPLTGLANRNRFHSDFERALADAKRLNCRLALLFLDLDKFKRINDELGHPAGDALLEQVASRLLSAARESNTVARLGGDEFAIIMTHLGKADAPEPLASRIIEALSTPFDLAGQTVEIGTSIGISVYPDDDTNAEELVRKADSALYQAKSAGRGNFQLYDAVLHDKIRTENRIVRELRLAIDRNEFTLHYQPQIDISTNCIIGAEALIRWQHPERGLLSPAEFISVAESSDLIVEIGRVVLQMACKQAKHWQDEPAMPDFRVAVNISPRQFKSDDLVALVDATLNQTGLAAEWLELEITESTMMEDVEQVSETLSRLTKLGVCIAIDDFGTGYSSLAYLKRFPVRRLKIDQSFVR